MTQIRSSLRDSHWIPEAVWQEIMDFFSLEAFQNPLINVYLNFVGERFCPLFNLFIVTVVAAIPCRVDSTGAIRVLEQLCIGILVATTHIGCLTTSTRPLLVLLIASTMKNLPHDTWWGNHHNTPIPSDTLSVVNENYRNPLWVSKHYLKPELAFITLFMFLVFTRGMIFMGVWQLL